MRLGFLAATIVLASTLGCGGDSTPTTDCEDGVDNDGDFLIDDLDPGCVLNGGISEAPDPAECNDGLDNDGDTFVDLDDIGCEGESDDEEADPTRQCNDGVDNDLDGEIDLLDIGCDSPIDNDEYNPPECGDGLDNDADGIVDYPFEPGCQSPEDIDEVDPIPPPVCSDGVDNDGDGFIDFQFDPGCEAASDVDEFHFIPSECGTSLDVIDLTTVGHATGSIVGPRPSELSSPECHGNGGEFVYKFTVEASSGPTALVVSTDYPETTLDTVVYVRTDCQDPGTELGCDDDGGALDSSSKLVITDAPAGDYHIIVDSFGPSSLGSFKVTIEVRGGLHGSCVPSNPTACAPGLICQPLMPGLPNTCEYPRCMDTIDNDGDSLIDYPFEPGCDSPTDNNEVDPSPLPQCGNGIDDDSDGFIDYTGGDPGCDSAADGLEIDECVPGAPVIDHPGGSVTGTTVGGSSVLASPSGCGSTTTGTSPERVYFHDTTIDLASITFSITAASFDTVLYVRQGTCSIPGTTTMCQSPAGNLASVTIVSPPHASYFAIVDGQFSTSGTFTLSIVGRIPGGNACTPGDLAYICNDGFFCDTATSICIPAACNDGIDNDGDGHIDYPSDWGCTSISDPDEVGVGPVPQCADGIDNDLDGFIDYPADPSCSAAADDDESCTFMYAADGQGAFSGSLYEINLCGATMIVTTIGSIGFPLTGMAFTSDGTLYGSESTSFSGTADLITINTTTGAGTTVGPLNTSGGVNQQAVPDIAAIGLQLYGWTESGDHFMTIDRTTGIVSVFTPSTGSFGSGLAADAAGTMYAALSGGTGLLRTVNISTGTTSSLVTMSGSFDAINSLTWHEGELYGILKSFPTAALGRINTTTGVITNLGPIAASVDALASPVP